MVKLLTIEEVERIAHVLAKKFMDWGEPIPDFSTRYPNKLESCLVVPFQKFDGKDLYKGTTYKGAVLFYLLIKNHPFQNGNKQIALTSLLVYLSKNKKWISVDNQEFYNFAVWVAASPPSLKDNTVDAIHTFIEKHITDFV